MCVCVCVCVCVRVCVDMQSLFLLHLSVQQNKYFIETKVFPTDALHSGSYLSPFYTVPLFVSMSVAWRRTVCLTDGDVFATVNQHTYSVTTKQQLHERKHSNYRMLPGITSRHSIIFTSSFLCVCMCVCIEMLPESSALFETDAI